MRLTIATCQICYTTNSLGSAIGANGRCYAWDSRANGYGRGEGVASLLLKPLSAALQDEDRMHAVIRDSGLNQDGKTTTIMSPSADAQVKLIQECYRRVGFDLSETGNVEAHMTGTSAGNPIEAMALARTFSKSRDAHDPVIVGSVKTNVGHTGPVSGLAAIIKTIFALKNKLIPPNLKYDTGNPAIPLGEWHLRVPTTLTPWPKHKLLRASINNFGYSGTNGHLILDPAPIPTIGARPNGAAAIGKTNGSYEAVQWRVYVVSAKDSLTCQAMMRRLAAHIVETIPSVADLAYTLSERRSRHAWVAVTSARTVIELVDRLQEPLRTPSHSSKRPRLGFVFNNQGAQCHAKGRELILAYPVFRQAIHAADGVLSCL